MVACVPECDWRVDWRNWSWRCHDKWNKQTKTPNHKKKILCAFLSVIQCNIKGHRCLTCQWVGKCVYQHRIPDSLKHISYESNAEYSNKWIWNLLEKVGLKQESNYHHVLWENYWDIYLQTGELWGDGLNSMGFGVRDNAMVVRQ